ncbi:carboxymuconolactone decarboxylase family protein [bacterium]|nr:MAG: carboxymuconolactone decarboxylase family protein [bacterium]
MKNDKTDKRVKRLIKEMEKERGYLPAPWKYVVQKDIAFMEAYNKLYTCGLNDGKALPVKTRELIAIVLLAFRGNENGVYEHIKRALKHGATKQEILEALETSVIPGGVPTLATGLRGLMRIEEEEEKKTL